MEEAAYDEMISRLEKVAKDNNLLWRRLPSAGDTAVFHHPSLNKANFCAQVRKLLYGDAPTPMRLQTFSISLTAHDLPNKWPLPTYLLFITHPESDIFVKPQTASWFLKFMGETNPVSGEPDGETYRLIRDHAHELLEALQPYGARDMVDVQSFIWVCYRESRNRTGHLDAKGQVDLDVPATEPLSKNNYEQLHNPVVLREVEDESFGIEPMNNASSKPYFTSKTFQLLNELHVNPTQTFYLENKEDFQINLEIPFKNLFLEIAELLPAEIKSVLETKKRLFSKIPKNDFGQGGTWDFYWAAFYPVGSKRTADAQLSIWINRTLLEFGFYIGDYGKQHQARFQKNCRIYYDELLSLLQPILIDEHFVYGSRETFVEDSNGLITSNPYVQLQDWLKNPESHSFDLSYVLTKDEVLSITNL